MPKQLLLALEAGFATAQRVVVTFFRLLDGERPWRWCIGRLPHNLQILVPQAIRRNFLGFFWGQHFWRAVLVGAWPLAGVVSRYSPYRHGGEYSGHSRNGQRYRRGRVA
ncbi:MAG TPA: hypothetical protein DCQ32_05195 [Cyanobacteria bacterium UBA8156]|nr:hypothetical protein [Cyanobacteria bacterium UBA8156]